MKLPLPANTLPTLSLSPEAERMIEAVADAVVKDTLQQYQEHLMLNNGVVDARRWKKIKQRERLRVYKQRTSSWKKTGSACETVRSSSSSSGYSTEKGETTAILPMLVFGSIPGTLDDVMYGSLSPSLEEMQLQSAYMEDGMADWSLLASITKPSKEHPFRELSIKWSIKRHPALIGVVMRTRDGVFIDSVGISFLPNGERIGYHLYHSMDIPEILELTDLQIVRGRLSICSFFRQRSETSVETFGCGMVSPMGDAPASLTAISSAEATVAVFTLVYCAEMKKFTRVVCSAQQQQQQEPWLRSITGSSSFGLGSSFSSVKISLNPVPVPLSSSKICGVCSQTVGSGLSSVRSKEKHCRICLVRLCSRCRVYKIIYLPTKVEKQLSSRKMTFCSRCVQSVCCASSAEFAMFDALAAEGNEVDYSDVLR